MQKKLFSVTHTVKSAKNKEVLQSAPDFIKPYILEFFYYKIEILEKFTTLMFCATAVLLYLENLEKILQNRNIRKSNIIKSEADCNTY
jgi:hypothetical protein